MPWTSAAKLEPDPVSPCLWGFTPGGRPSAPRAPTKHGSGPGAGPTKPHLVPTRPRGFLHLALAAPKPLPVLTFGNPRPTHSERETPPQLRHTLPASVPRLPPSAGPTTTTTTLLSVARPPDSAPRSRPRPHQSTEPLGHQPRPRLGAGLMLTQLRPSLAKRPWTREKLPGGCSRVALNK